MRLLTTVLSCLTALSGASGAILSVAGTQYDDGAWWRTATSNKVYDLDANQVLGSDGYEVVNRSPSQPSYIGSMTILTGTYPGNGLYAVIDDPASPPGTFVSGTMNPYPGTGVWADLYTFTVNENVPGRVIRVGLLVDNLDIAGYNSYRMALAQSGAGGTTVEVITISSSFNNRNPDWIFFDIARAVSGDVFNVRGMGGSNVTATLGGVAFDSVEEGTVRYVAPSASHAFPYITWLTAATNIQDAIDSAPAGAIVLVSNGVYATGGRPTPGSLLTNRVVIDKPMLVTSVNGPEFTVIRGAKDPLTTNGDAAVRCAYVTNGATLAGFTLTNGATRATGDAATEQGGGGVRCQSTSTTISNCIIVGNSAVNGGGARNARLYACRLAGNRAIDGGGAYVSSLTNCVVEGNVASQNGGGMNQCVALNTTVRGNVAGGSGGGNLSSPMYGCTIISNEAVNGGGTAFAGPCQDCLLAYNTASSQGGGAYFATLYNCTIVKNSAGSSGGGTAPSFGTLYNSIIYSNTAPTFPNYDGGTFTYSCSTPLPGGTGNTADDPQLVDWTTSNFRLRASSPCRDTANNGDALSSFDLDGNPRIAGGTVDMGAYEYDQALSHYDSDGDTWTDAEEYIADTQPTNAASYFADVTLSNAPQGTMALQVGWSSTGRIYFVEWTTDLAANPQTWVQTGLAERPGNDSIISFVVTNDAPGRSYRTGVRLP